jgi:lysophospholipase L1-like esterase
MKKIKFNRFILTLCIFISHTAFAQKQKVSCVGNSITYGYDLPKPSTQSYPGQMQVLLGTTEWEVGNFGSSGRTMLKSGGYSYWDDQLYKNALASNPNFVVIELGTNDSKRWLWDWKGSEFKSDYTTFVQSFQNLSSKPEIWIGLLIPGEKTDWDIYNTYIKDKVNPKIKEVALEMGLGLIDLYTELSANKSEWYLPDSVHPSIAGAGLIAQKVREMLLMPIPEVTYANGMVTAPYGDDFQWYLNGVMVSSDKGGKSKEMIVTESGKYKVSVKISANNETRIVSKELDVQLTSVRANCFNKINVYPNPAFDVVYLQVDNIEGDATCTISDISGKLVLKEQILNGRGEINIGRFSAGTYILAIGTKHIKVIKSA